MKFRIGIIGCGNIFPMHAVSIRDIKGLELVAVCDQKPQRAKAAAAKYNCNYYFDYQRMLEKEKLDVLHILTPHYLHPPMAIAALKRKINVLTEKPFCINPADGKKMIEAARKNRVKLGVIFQNRYSPGSQLVKKHLVNGDLGKIKAVRLILAYAKPDSYYNSSDWKGTMEKEGGGVLIDQAIHFVDLLRWFADDQVEFVEAFTARRMHNSIEVEDMAEGVIKFKKGAYICFYLINFYSYDSDVEVELDCQKGRVRMVKDSARVGLYNGREIIARPKPKEYLDYGKGRKDYWGVCHSLQIKQFYQALAAHQEPEINGVEGLETQRVIWNIYKSAKEGRRIYLK